jgi:7-cyano-7-deazaguanine reductase
MDENPLGKPTEYTETYAPELLFAVPRKEARRPLDLSGDLPFQGSDIWNAWELTWLDLSGKPQVATATFVVDSKSDNIIESKSLKLYLNSFSMTRFASAADISKTITTDLSATASANVDVIIHCDTTAHPIVDFQGQCIDENEMESVSNEVDASVLRSDDDRLVSETLYSHLLRSNCPVTNQPDMGSIMIEYVGPKIRATTLLQYIVSYRQHSDFHEACVERIFLDIQKQCKPENLTVYARFNRRGGLDINPYRTNTAKTPKNLRLWRQ